MSINDLVEKVLPIAKEMAYGAARVIMSVYQTDFSVQIKDDNSPVTLADLNSDIIIRTLININFPTHSILTEEGEDDKERLNSEYIWIIDPLDGTKNFVNKDGEFAINIALVKEHQPILGLVMLPVSGELYYAVAGYGSYYVKNRGAKEERIHVSNKDNDLILLTSVFHKNEDELKLSKMFKERIKEQRQVGSSIKACLIAKGEADVSFRFNPNTKEWDTCAPQLIVEEAGGYFTQPDGSPITYNRKDVYNRNGFSIYNKATNNFSKDYLNKK